MKYLRGCIICLCLIVMGICLWKMYAIQSRYHRSDSVYGQLEAYAQMPAPKENTDLPAVQVQGEEALISAQFPKVDFEALAQINSDVVGWICIPDTKINYPIAQTRDDYFYLDFLFDKTPNENGSIFLDAHNKADFSDTNSFIFGHNVKSGSMFAGLMDFKKQEFYEDHPTYLLLTPDDYYVVEIFAADIVAKTGHAWDTGFETAEDRQAWLDRMEENSLITTGLHPQPDDRVVALSTCTYEFPDARLLVLGILRKAQPV